MLQGFVQTWYFLSSDANISAIFNTDGVPLYSSSSVKLWPIFLAVNELPPSERFAKGNMILAGIWQGKGNPPFMQYIATFGDEMVDLYNTGVGINPGYQDEQIHVQFGVFLGTMDLQAKSYVLNMSHHNGASGCITCEEPGKTVQQGKGTTRCYPYRPISERYPIRQSDDLKFNIGPRASTAERNLWSIWDMCHALVRYSIGHCT